MEYLENKETTMKEISIIGSIIKKMSISNAYAVAFIFKLSETISINSKNNKY